MTGFRWTIKRKLLALGAATLLPLLGLIAFWVRWEVREHTRAAEAELALASQQAAIHVEMVLDQARALLLALARHPAVQRRELERMEGRFRDTLREHPQLENLFAVTADGRPFATAVAPAGGVLLPVGERPWFQQVMVTGRPAVGGFEIGKIINKPVALVAVPWREQDHAVVGVLAAAISLRELNHLLFKALALAGGRTVTVIDGEGQVLSHAPEAEGWLGRRLPSAASLPPEAAMVPKLDWIEGEKRVVGVAPVGGTPWRVLFGLPRASLEARAWKEVRAIGLPLLALLALSSLIGLLIAQRVWRPLRVLADAAKKLPQGELRAIQVSATDEVGDLARAFNAMTAEVAEARSRLEEQVAELAALTETGRLLTGTLELSEVLNRLIELARTRLGADVAGIWLREEPSGLARLYAEVGAGARPQEYRMRFRPGQGLVGWIMEQREPLVLADCRTDPRLFDRESMAAEGLHSFLGVPILLEDVVVGVLVCLRRERHEFAQAEVALAQLFALPAAVAIRNARLYEESRQTAAALAEQNRQRQLLHEAERALITEYDLPSLLQKVVETATEVIGARYGALAVFGDDGKIAQFHTTGIEAETRERIGSLPEGRGLLGATWRAEAPLRLEDLGADPRAVGFPPHHPPMRRLLATPIRLKDRTLGAIYLTEKENGFTVEDETSLTTLSAGAAVAIENARLVEKLNRALEELSAAQQQLVRSQTLRAVGVLASGAAHHLNNLLAVILGNIQLLLEEARRPEIRHPLELVEQTTQDAAEVVRRFHRFSRVEPFANMVPVDLNALARELLERPSRSGATRPRPAGSRSRSRSIRERSRP